MASVYLIRHGQASFGDDDYDKLSSLGEVQARLVGESLRAKMARPSRILTGTMLRHQQTAQQALAAFAQDDVDLPEPVSQACWNEYAHQEILGAYDTRFATAAGIKAHLQHSSHPEKTFLNLFNAAVARWMSGEHDTDYSETWLQFTARLQSGIQSVIADLQAKENVLIFTSGGPISYLAQSYLGVPKENLMQMNWTLVNTGITKLIRSRQGVFVASLNEHSIFEKPENQHCISYK
ncbi:histidine phosphatase family protein [Alteromonas sp. a30]|uniref:histidine phosphatase family protein n=1 Tax=Alteromonas sp. a30 TaxID=2730917 RepID=UPI002280D557|nr:histidine phosphatase family protein [Alteromonas sp. a30]MCY7295586.1 histidine phosphatase family protein [Alteromonas sp. a30]